MCVYYTVGHLATTQLECPIVGYLATTLLVKSYITLHICSWLDGIADAHTRSTTPQGRFHFVMPPLDDRGHHNLLLHTHSLTHTHTTTLTCTTPHTGSGNSGSLRPLLLSGSRGSSRPPLPVKPVSWYQTHTQLSPHETNLLRGPP